MDLLLNKYDLYQYKLNREGVAAQDVGSWNESIKELNYNYKRNIYSEIFMSKKTLGMYL